MSFVSFACMHCRRRLKTGIEHAGKCVVCPHCRFRTEVPELEDGPATYGIGDEAGPAQEEAPPRTEREIWRGEGHAELAAATRERLRVAREHADEAEWEEAVGILQKLFRRSEGGKMTRENAVFRIPLAHCLTQWSRAELQAIDDEDCQLSTPMRMLLKNAEEKLKFGGAFELNECSLCMRPLGGRRAKTAFPTVVGTAQVCCAAPNADDRHLLGRVDAIRQRLRLATMLDERNPQTWETQKELPWWANLLHKPSGVKVASSLAWMSEDDVSETMFDIAELLFDLLSDA